MLGLAVATQAPDSPDATIRDAIDALQKAENLLADLDRAGLLKRLDELREAVETFPQTQLDLRMARIRLQSHLGSDPDKTPVRPPSAYSLRLKLDPK